jgi:hypothetical protein
MKGEIGSIERGKLYQRREADWRPRLEHLIRRDGQLSQHGIYDSR